jgi:hypothetical protein
MSGGEVITTARKTSGGEVITTARKTGGGEVITTARKTAPAPRRPCRLVGTPWPHKDTSLVGHAMLNFSGSIVRRAPIFRSRDGALSVGPPTGPERCVKVGENGKRQFWAQLSFERKVARERFSRMALAALAEARIVVGVAP